MATGTESVARFAAAGHLGKTPAAQGSVEASNVSFATLVATD